MRLGVAIMSTVAVLVALATGTASAANLLVNGSFEEGVDVPSPPGYLTIFDGSTEITGWVVKTPVPGRNIDRVSTYWQNSDGAYSLDLNGDNPPGGGGGIAQTFPTLIGQTYYVTFDIASNPTLRDFAHFKTIEVSAGGQSQQFSADSIGHTLADMGWETHTWSFVAQSTSTELWFYMIYPDYSAEGMALDNVRVEVPEPASVSLLVLGGCLVIARRVRRLGAKTIPAVLVVLCLSAASTRAVSIETVTVGNLGNAPDNTGYGAVDYAYSMGKCEVTVGQYCEFLNAVAKTDAYGLYNQYMDLAQTSGACGIKRSGSSGNYSYSVQDWRDGHPVNYVNYWNACRFANWLHNGQPTGTEGPGTTETGAYTLNGGGGWRTPGARWVVPSEDEWYKAAYHKNDGVTGNYWGYPTASDVINTSMANYDFSIGHPVNVGSYAYPSPYGTFDQGGNVQEWNEAILSGSFRVLRGGWFGPYDYCLHASYRDYNTAYYPEDTNTHIGFRVAYVPEPSALALMALGGVAMLRRRLGRPQQPPGPHPV